MNQEQPKERPILTLCEMINVTESVLILGNRAAAYKGNEIVKVGRNSVTSNFISKEAPESCKVRELVQHELTEEVEAIVIRFAVIPPGRRKPVTKEFLLEIINCQNCGNASDYGNEEKCLTKTGHCGPENWSNWTPKK